MTNYNLQKRQGGVIRPIFSMALYGHIHVLFTYKKLPRLMVGGNRTKSNVHQKVAARHSQIQCYKCNNGCTQAGILMLDQHCMNEVEEPLQTAQQVSQNVHSTPS